MTTLQKTFLFLACAMAVFSILFIFAIAFDFKSGAVCSVIALFGFLSGAFYQISKSND